MAYNDLIRRGDALAAVQAAYDDSGFEPDLADAAARIAALPAVTVGVKPLVWDGFVSGCYRIEIKEGGIANLWRYSAEMVENEEPDLICGGYLTLISMDELKAKADADHAARIRAALTSTHVGASQAPDPVVNDPAAIREAALREAEEALRDWQDSLNTHRSTETAITVGMAADVVLALIDKEPGNG